MDDDWVVLSEVHNCDIIALFELLLYSWAPVGASGQQWKQMTRTGVPGEGCGAGAKLQGLCSKRQGVDPRHRADLKDTHVYRGEDEEFSTPKNNHFQQPSHL